MTQTILYLHGFLSSPASSKVEALKAAAAARNASAGGDLKFAVAAPDLNVPPKLVSAYLEALAKTYDAARLTIVGSSLGGFYAGRLARQTGAKVVLVNPCLNPWDFVTGELGCQQVYGTDRHIEVSANYAADFRALAEAVSPVPDLLRTLTLLSTADEVLDWRLAWEKLQGARIILSAGDDHRMSRFEAMLPAVLDFAASH